MNTRVAGTIDTDAHIAALRREIAHLTEEIGHPSTPAPLRERLRQRVASLQGIADRHDKTRVVFPEGGGDDR